MSEQLRKALEDARWRIANLVGPKGAQGIDREVLDRIDAALAQQEEPQPVAQAWFHRGMANFDYSTLLAALDDGRGTPIDLYAAAPAEEHPEVAQLRAQNDHLVALYDAVANLVKVKGRHHTEQAYQRLVKAFDAAKDGKPAEQEKEELDSLREQAATYRWLEDFAKKSGFPSAAGAITWAMLSERRAEAEQQAPATEQAPSELRKVLAFLLGEGELQGVWFGEKPVDERGAFWWRKPLRAALRSEQAPANLNGSNSTVLEQAPAGEVPSEETQAWEHFKVFYGENAQRHGNDDWRGYRRGWQARATLSTPPAVPRYEPLSVDDARQTLWAAIESIKIGNKTDDKLILAELWKRDVYLCSTAPAAPKGEQTK